MTEQETQAVARHPAEAVVPEPLPDDQNPAIIDARKTFVITIIGAVLFIGSIVVFIL